MKEQFQVLVVDDLADWRQTLGGLLSDEGFVVTTVASRQEALEILSAQRFDVAVLDVRLDETDEHNREGLRLMHVIRAQCPNTQVIILTGYADVDAVREALQPDDKGHSLAFGFLEKTEPDIRQLVNYVKRAVVHYQPLKIPQFEPSQECKIIITLEPGHRLLVRGNGAVSFTHSSQALLALDVNEFRRWADIVERPMADRRFLLKESGDKLHKALFGGHPVLDRSYARALGQVTFPRYLRLVFEGSSELLGVPLELLYYQEAREYLVLLHPVTRQIRGVDIRRSPISPDATAQLVSAGEKLHLLILVSNAEPAIDLIDKMGEQVARVLESVDWLDVTVVTTAEATHHRVQELLQGCKYHIVHYIGHGSFRKDSPEQSALWFWSGENRSGVVQPMTANQLRLLLQDSDVRLFHLTCCEGAQTGDVVSLLDDDSLGIADAIIQAGVPSVLGYRWPVPAARARDLTLAFYRSFIRHGSPPLALLEARQKLAMDDKDELSWASPILISQD